MASIDKRPDGRYRARWREPGGRQRAKHFTRKQDAVKHLATVTHDTARGAYVDPDAGRERFSVYAGRWAEAQDWKDSTRESFDAHLSACLPHLGTLRLDQVDELVLLSLRSALASKYAISTATISRALRVRHHALGVPDGPDRPRPDDRRLTAEATRRRGRRRRRTRPGAHP